VKRSLALAAVLAAVAAGALACTDETTGQPTPGTTTATQPSATGPSIPFPSGSLPTGTTQPSDGGGGTSPLAGKKACEVAQPVQQQLNAGNGDEADLAGVPHCRFTGAEFALDVAIYPENGLKDYQGDAKQITVGSHEGLRATDSLGVCTVAIGVSDTSRVEVNATKSDGSDACGLAMQGATALEPSLPR
jgi:hypothetical protein